MTDLLTLGALDLARHIAAGDVSAYDAVCAHIARIERVNPSLNALVADRFDHAIAEARLADEAFARGEPVGPLHGVPFTVKETLAVNGLPHTAGSASRTAVHATHDATSVARLMGAGAIPLGVSNTSELGLWVETDNRVWGRTNNPWDPRRTAGGSSGGDAALVAASGTPIALADDSVGSNRIPAAFCGVFAHKPTGGLVPLTGRYPVVYGKARRYTTVGPITRTADDLAPLLELLRGADGIDRGVLPIEVGSPADVDFTWKRVVICEDPGMPGVTPSREVRRAVRRAAELLEDRGAEVEEWRPRQFRHAADIWLSLHHEAWGMNHSFRDVLAEGDRLFLPLEFLRLATGRSRHTMPTLGLALTERFTRGAIARIQRFCAEGRRLRTRLNTVLGEGGVMLMPAWPTTAPKHGRTLRHPKHVVYAAIHNVLELPVTTVPMGLGRDGLPLGVQVVGAHGGDAVTIAAAQVLEAGAGGWRAPRLRQMRQAEPGL